MPIGTLFSICAGILIGMKLYYRYFYKEKSTKLESRKQMQEIVDQQKYGVVYLQNHEHIVELGNGKYLLVKDDNADRHFWHDLWYGSGWKSGKDS